MKSIKSAVISTFVIVGFLFLGHSTYSNESMHHSNLDQNRQSPYIELWTQILQAHVSENGNVNYETMKSDDRLNTIIEMVSQMTPNPNWKVEEEICFWINIYNIYTIKLIIDNYPINSIRDIEAPWNTDFVHLSDKSYSLDEIENKILRPKFGDPRIHFAINCASISCPSLYNRAFEPNTLSKVLDERTKVFINNQEMNRLNASTSEISEIFNWFKSDFDVHGGVIHFINKYSKIKLTTNTEIKYLPYNWGLNQ